MRGAGQSRVTATTETAPAKSQPRIRSGIVPGPPGAVTGRMKLSKIEVLAAASVELTTPAKSTRNPTTNIAETASQGLRETKVAMTTRTQPTATREV